MKPLRTQTNLGDRQGVVYKIECCDCQASYIGETGRNLSMRLTEHKRVTSNGDVNNHIAEHHFHIKLTGSLRHACITYSTDYYQRLTLESWFTDLEQTPLNRSQQLPAPYKQLIDDWFKKGFRKFHTDEVVWPVSMQASSPRRT